MGLQGFWDRLGQKVNKVLQASTVKLPPRDLLDFLVCLGNRAYLVHHFHLYQARVEIPEAPASQDLMDLQGPQVEEDTLALDLLDRLDLAASMDLWGLSDLQALLAQVQQDPLEVPDQLALAVLWGLADLSGLSALADLPDLLAKGLSGLQVQQEIQALLVRPDLSDLQDQMDLPALPDLV